MDFDLIVRNGTIATSSGTYAADVGVRGGRVVAIASSLSGGAVEIDARHLLVLPGGIDPHTHLDAPVGDATTADDFESGTAAAARGGITTIIDYAWQVPGQSIAEVIALWGAKAADKAHIDYAFHVVLGEVTEELLAEFPAAVEAGYPSIKVFLINEFVLGDRQLLRVLRAARDAGMLVNVHAENGDLLDARASEMAAAGRLDPRFFAESRPAIAETEATRRVIDYAAFTGAEIYVVHVSAAEALAAITAGRARGVRAWAETRPIYLALTDERYAVGGVEAAKVIGAPPLRSAMDQEALWAGLRNGEIQTIGSDNTSWSVAQKAVGSRDFRLVPYGVPGLETEMRVVFSEGVSKGRISLSTFVAAFSTNAARIFGLAPGKGAIAIGSDADFVLFDPAAKERIDASTLVSRAGYDPFDGLEVTGRPVMTVSRGEVIARDGQLLSRPGRGLSLRRSRTQA